MTVDAQEASVKMVEVDNEFWIHELLKAVVQTFDFISEQYQVVVEWLIQKNALQFLDHFPKTIRINK